MLPFGRTESGFNASAVGTFHVKYCNGQREVNHGTFIRHFSFCVYERRRNDKIDRAISIRHIFGDADAQCRDPIAACTRLGVIQSLLWNGTRAAELLRCAFQRRKHNAEEIGPSRYCRFVVDVNGERGLLHRSGEGDQEVQGR
jgi:hypothetical protein